MSGAVSIRRVMPESERACGGAMARDRRTKVIQPMNNIHKSLLIYNGAEHA